MSEKEEIKLFESIRQGILKAQRELYERKAKLGETVVVADKDGMPVHITGEEALRLMNQSHPR